MTTALGGKTAQDRRQPVQIALTCNDAYALHAMMVVYSLASQASHGFSITPATSVQVHYCTLPDASAKTLGQVERHLEAICAPLGWDFTIHQPAFALMPQMSENPNKAKSAAIFLRLYFSAFLSGTVLYLDPDLLAFGDIAGYCAQSAIPALSASPYAMAAVPDAGLCRRVRRHLTLKRLGLGVLTRNSGGGHLVSLLGAQAARAYFNSGVMLVDLARWRDRGFDQEIQAMGDIGQLRYRDQDALNLLAQKDGGYLPLSLRLNHQAKYDNPTQVLSALDPVPLLKHYIGPKKPWLVAEPSAGVGVGVGAGSNGGAKAKSWVAAYWQQRRAFDAFALQRNLLPLGKAH